MEDQDLKHADFGKGAVREGEGKGKTGKKGQKKGYTCYEEDSDAQEGCERCEAPKRQRSQPWSWSNAPNTGKAKGGNKPYYVDRWIEVDPHATPAREEAPPAREEDPWKI